MAPPPAPPPPQAIKDIQAILTPKTVFVTSQNFNGNLGGLEGADEKCQAAADTAGLAGTDMAWLSDDNESPAQRFKTLAVGAYIKTDGATVAGNWGDLTDGTLNRGIDRDEDGNDLSGLGVWTGTNVDGSKNPNNCLNWTDGSAANTGLEGLSGATNSIWTALNIPPCSNLTHLYCFEQ
ncbi:MAG: hypothetical protein ACREOW_11405 [Thermodesulfobacteriota bacterium]